MRLLYAFSTRHARVLNLIALPSAVLTIKIGIYITISQRKNPTPVAIQSIKDIQKPLSAFSEEWLK